MLFRSEEISDCLIDAFEDFHVVAGTSRRGWATVTFTIQALSFRQAVRIGAALLESEQPWPVLSMEVVQSDEFWARTDFGPLPALLSTSQAADRLGVTHARVQQLIDSGKLHAIKVGRSWVVPLPSVLDRLERRKS